MDPVHHEGTVRPGHPVPVSCVTRLHRRPRPHLPTVTDVFPRSLRGTVGMNSGEVRPGTLSVPFPLDPGSSSLCHPSPVLGRPLPSSVSPLRIFLVVPDTDVGGWDGGSTESLGEGSIMRT